VERVAKELKAFKKVMIDQGSTVEVELEISVQELAYYDTKTSKWIVEPGQYKLLAGTSAGDIKETIVITIE